MDAWSLFRTGVPDLDLEVLADWERIGRAVRLAVTPRTLSGDVRSVAQANVRAAPVPYTRRTQTRRTVVVPALEEGRRWNTATTAVQLDVGVEALRTWLYRHPEAAQLDGNTVRKSNPSPWLHLKVYGYAGGAVFTSKFGPVFNGDDYNGVVNFHGDATVDALRRFVDVYEAAETHLDVLVPSATHESSESLRRGTRVIKPKFALRGYSGAPEGFFLYHDNHAGIPVPRQD